MKQLLLIDSDTVQSRTYRERLSAHGFRVNTAANAATALSLLHTTKPDLVVLDLMLPDLSGIELVRLMRQQPKLAPTPVMVLTNSYGNGFGRQAANLGIEKAFLKAECSPSVLMAAIDEMFHPGLATAKPSEPDPEPVGDFSTSWLSPSVRMPRNEQSVEPGLAAAERPEPVADLETPMAPPPAEPLATTPMEDAAQEFIEEPALTEEPALEAQARFLDDAPAILADLTQEFEALAREPGTGPEQLDHLQELFYKVHVLAVAASQTEFALLAQTMASFDALLQTLVENPERLDPGVLRTVGSLVEVVRRLFQHARESDPGAPLGTRVLVVDDDPLANQMVVGALCRAQFDACSTEDSFEAWQWLNREHFDLVLLDIEMPMLDGWELCERLRMVPGYEETPVIFLTAHDDPDTLSRSTLSGADELMVKPIRPQELAAKVLVHLVKTQISV